MAKRKFIIDCDTGIDDAHAILMALYDEQIDVIAITTVFGNSTLEPTTKNTFRVLKIADKPEIPVFGGCSESILGVTSKCDGFMGNDGLGDVDRFDLPDKHENQTEHAALALVRLANEHPGAVTLVVTGPLTNIAVALKLDPGFGKKLKDAYIMGGNIYGRGNVTVCEEFNFYSDREAAYIVLNQLQCPITLIPLETCTEHSFSWAWYEEFSAISTTQAEFLHCIYAKRVSTDKEEKAPWFGSIWDQLCMAIALDNNVAMETKSVYVTVELRGEITRGQMIVDWKNTLLRKPNVNLVTNVDMDLFSHYMYQGANAKQYTPKCRPQ